VSWLPCTEAPGYLVSDTGEVKNRFGRILRGQTFPNGYRGIVFQRGGKCYLIHRLVLSAFIRPAEEREDANHKNGVRADNRLKNLEWVSHSDNIKHSHAELNRKPHAWSTPVALTKGEDRTRFENMHDAAKFLGVVHGSVRSAFVKKHLCRGYVVEAA
jgi:HNH endonuclease